MCRGLSLPSHSHDMNTAGVEAIKMHSSLWIVDTSLESRWDHESQRMLPVFHRNCAFDSYSRDRLLHMGRLFCGRQAKIDW
jgi:hypothetical protein